MKKQRIYKILGIALSITMAAAVIPAQAATTQDCNHAGHAACHIDYDQASATYINPTQHRIDYYEVHICRRCGDEHNGSHTVYENHDYERDYVTNMLVCTGCGDTYK